MTSREQEVAETFVELADTLVAEFDLVDFLHTLIERTVRLLDGDAGGIMLADQRGGLEVMAATSHEVRLVELFELQSDEGPCLEAFHTGQAVTKADLGEMRRAWPDFTARLEQAGFASAQAVPMRLRDEVIGAVNVFRVATGALSEADMRLARALADVATVGLMQERTIRSRDLLAEQLQAALDSRVLIEQAKGVLAERTGVEVGEAFTVLRSHARRTGVPLHALAAQVVSGALRL
ncbi:GAF domain-containing protein [Geodermatophilus bullaregiensis]|uniref:GAF and ANTAR domain-containing protein n=1 Tax=Geodermatophilus bullaregiensis TaxID=1564160 RepID=UPI0019587448|nr:GAF and ANTAR domain-containing protein [Geodermatophilus bullaregiensis]MBM7808007.1 GAF domain-containing protein [Geodermatophilus bullaregiensis]